MLPPPPIVADPLGLVVLLRSAGQRGASATMIRRTVTSRAARSAVKDRVGPR